MCVSSLCPWKSHHFIKDSQVGTGLLELPRTFCGWFLEALELALVLSWVGQQTAHSGDGEQPGGGCLVLGV